MAIDLDQLEKAYFWFDEPVPYKLKDGHTIFISPIVLKDSEIFKSCVDILDIDKNSLPDAKIISMSYLQFLIEYVLVPTGEANQTAILKLASILKLCLGWEHPAFQYNSDGKPFLADKGIEATIAPKDFEDIRRIIMHQNFPHYDDSYINPDAKKAMADVDKLRSQDIDIPTLERQMAIISSHTGITKVEQQSMTCRAHTLLFEEVCGEVYYTTQYTASAISRMLGSKNSEMEAWIYKKKKGKFDGYFVSDRAYNKSMGGDGNISQVNVDTINLQQQYNSFTK